MLKIYAGALIVFYSLNAFADSSIEDLLKCYRAIGSASQDYGDLHVSGDRQVLVIENKKAVPAQQYVYLPDSSKVYAIPKHDKDSYLKVQLPGVGTKYLVPAGWFISEAEFNSSEVEQKKIDKEYKQVSTPKRVENVELSDYLTPESKGALTTYLQQSLSDMTDTIEHSQSVKWSKFSKGHKTALSHIDHSMATLESCKTPDLNKVVQVETEKLTALKAKYSDPSSSGSTKHTPASAAP